MNTRHIHCKIIVMVGSLFFSLHSNAQSTLFYFTSSPQSWIGQGQTVLATPTNGFSILPETGIYSHEVGFVIKPTHPDDRWWWIEMDCPPTDLTVGFYPDAERLGGNTGPGLDFYTSGRGDNTLTGYFDVLEISYDANHTLLSFAADFVQYDVGVTSLWNQGSIRYNSTIPVPEPSTFSLLGICLLAFCYCLFTPNQSLI